MKKFFLLLMSLPMIASAVLPSTGAFELDRSGSVQRKYSLGSNLQEAQTFGLKGVWSVDKQGGSIASHNLKNPYLSEDVVLPAGAIIVDCFFDEVQPVVSAGVSPQISLGANSTTDLKAATTATGISGRVDCIPEGTLSNSVKLTAERTLTLSVSSEAATAGKVNVFIQYVLSE